MWTWLYMFWKRKTPSMSMCSSAKDTCFILLIWVRYGLTLTTVLLIAPCFTSSQCREVFGILSALSMSQIICFFTSGMSRNVWSILSVTKCTFFLPLLELWWVWLPPKPRSSDVVVSWSSPEWARTIWHFFNCQIVRVVLRIEKSGYTTPWQLPTGS